MKREYARNARLEVGLIATFAMLATLTVALLVSAGPSRAQPDGVTASPANVFTVSNLVTDAGSSAPSHDPSLVNGWGLSAGPATPWWASDNGTNLSTLYNGAGAKQPLTVTVAGGPTGTVFNGSTTDFVVTQNGKSGAARFLFATEAGKILGWSPTVNGTTALTGVDRSSKKAVYKGLATLNDRLYATSSPRPESSKRASRPAGGRTHRRTRLGDWRWRRRTSGLSPTIF
jgi:hypothetical protein